jgi:uncharacterized protein (TIGR00369 family)
MTYAPPNHLQQWLDQETQVRRIMLPHGVTPISDVLPCTGLELIQGMLEGRIRSAPFSKLLDFLVVEAREGHVVFQGTPSAEFLNPMGTVHGGWFATLLDSAMGCAVHTLLPAGRGYTTSGLTVNLVKALTPKVQRVRAIGQVLHSGRQLATAEARLVGPDGTLYAHATSTCLVFDIPGQSKS